MSGIYIKPENRGKFTATKERTGKTTEELTHSKNPLTRKRAIFAQNAAKWNHEDGGIINYMEDGNKFDINTLIARAKTQPAFVANSLSTGTVASVPSNKPIPKWRKYYITPPKQNISDNKQTISWGGGKSGGAGSTSQYDPVTGKLIEHYETPHYIQTETFNQAFAKARKQGLKQFEFNGKKYTTEMGNDPRANAAGNKRVRTTGVIKGKTRLIDKEYTTNDKLKSDTINTIYPAAFMPIIESGIKEHKSGGILKAQNGMKYLPVQNTNLGTATVTAKRLYPNVNEVNLPGVTKTAQAPIYKHFSGADSLQYYNRFNQPVRTNDVEFIKTFNKPYQALKGQGMNDQQALQELKTQQGAEFLGKSKQYPARLETQSGRRVTWKMPESARVERTNTPAYQEGGTMNHTFPTRLYSHKENTSWVQGDKNGTRTTDSYRFLPSNSFFKNVIHDVRYGQPQVTREIFQTPSGARDTTYTGNNLKGQEFKYNSSNPKDRNAVNAFSNYFDKLKGRY